MKQKIIHNQDGKALYQITVANDFSNLSEVLSPFCMKRKVCIVSDSNVASIYLGEVEKYAKEVTESVFSFVFPAGEASKNLQTVEKLYSVLIQNSFDRNDVLLALGGGVTGDLTGFAAATFLRGIRFIGLPTSLLSMVDSSIGGKTGVDFQSYKNMVGAFYQPSAVYISLQALKSLPDREFSSGMGEVIKHGLIKDEAYFKYIKLHTEEILKRSNGCLEELIFQSLCIKGEVVEQDPKEKGERALLNFGHTLGHAIEKLNNFRLSHGECVALGCIAAAEISFQKGNLIKDDMEQIIHVFDAYSLPIKTDTLDKNQFLSVCHHDKKADRNRIRFVLLQKIGQAYLTEDVTDLEIWSAFHSIESER